MTKFKGFKVPYPVDKRFKQPVAYFCMEFAIDQALKIYSGGLGFLAGSHMRSAYDLRQNLIGIGILWKYGYYDQVRRSDRSMDVLFQEKIYSFLEDTGIEFQIMVNAHPVWVKVYYLAPEIFGSAPMFFLTTEHPNNDHLATTISHRLYDANPEAKIAQGILLGKGGAQLLDILGFAPETYHFNEAHALPAAFHLYEKFGDLETVKQHVVFTTHTPVPAGNEIHNIQLLEKMSFFGNIPLREVRRITGTEDDWFNHTLAALRMARLSNGVSKIHGEVAREMWGDYSGICPITSVTNAQNKAYWHDPALEAALLNNDDAALVARKKEMKRQLFQVVADQNGKLFDPNVLTIVWARRFANYKRGELITRDLERFEAFIKNAKYPVQIIWAGKPYPTDYDSVAAFNTLIRLSSHYPQVAVLTGYELALSKLLKQGADVWLNNPRIPREASGTSGMTAAMNGSVNLSTYDGWIPEFVEQGKNGFMIPAVDQSLPTHSQDEVDRLNLLNILEQEIMPMYYDRPKSWLKIVKASMKDVAPAFDSDRMAEEYYRKMYTSIKVAVSGKG